MGTSLLIPLEAPTFGAQNFDKSPFFSSIPWFNEPMLLAIISMFLIIPFWLIMARKNALVPSRSQYIGEFTYSFIRDGVARDQIGHDFRKYLPYLLGLFSFLMVNNIWGVFPVFVFPTTSLAGWTYGMALMSWVLFNGVGIRKHGFFGYLRQSTLPSGVPWPLWFLVIPIEFASNIIIRPVTLALRLFANMFAGHLLLLVFVIGGEYLLLESHGIVNNVAGGLSLIFSLAIFALELFVEAFQAYIFVILSAQYVGAALSEEH